MVAGGSGSKTRALSGVRAASLLAALAGTAAFGLLPAGPFSLRARSAAVSTPVSATGKPPLDGACRETAAWLSRQLGPHGRAVARPPFVVAGLASKAKLDAWYQDLIAPAARAMAAEYFDRAGPDEPITVVLASSEQEYRAAARTLFGDEDVSSFGYYRPHLRTILVNLGRGSSGLRHELTHALMAFDFPAAPAWLNEGLASLHEDGRVRPDGAGIDGEVNWRLGLLQEAAGRGRLLPLPDFFRDGDFHGAAKRLGYAQARYFCLYMERCGVLRGFYHRFRDEPGDDPTGAALVAAAFSGRRWGEIDADFRGWAMSLSAPASR